MRIRRVSRWGKPPACPCAGECKHTRSTRSEEAPSVRLTVRWHRLVEKWKDNKWEMAPRCQTPPSLFPHTCRDCCCWWRDWATYVNVFRRREAITTWGTTIITRRSHVAASANASCYNEKKATTTTATDWPSGSDSRLTSGKLKYRAGSSSISSIASHSSSVAACGHAAVCVVQQVARAAPQATHSPVPVTVALLMAMWLSLCKNLNFCQLKKA